MTTLFCRKLAITMFVGCLAAVFGPPVAKAAIIPNMFGNHRASAESDPKSKTTVNFAVYDREGGVSNDSFGTGYAGFDTKFDLSLNPSGLDTSAAYLYLYQVTNNSGNDYQVSDAVMYLQKGSVTSWGRWKSKLAFRDKQGFVGVGNPFGSDGAKFTPAASANTGVKKPGIESLGSKNPQKLVKPVLGLQYQPEWDVLNVSYSNRLDSGETSWIFGFTSNVPPIMYRTTRAECPDNYACGAFPIPGSQNRGYDLHRLTAGIDVAPISISVPEPANVGLVTLGIGGFAVLRRRRATTSGARPWRI